MDAHMKSKKPIKCPQMYFRDETRANHSDEFRIQRRQYTMNIIFRHY